MKIIVGLMGLVVFLTGWFVISSHAQEEASSSAATPVVAELFTSQSCSSCPPADTVLGELARTHNMIALGHHVTYWDHLSWKDTLSLEASTSLQQEFNASIGSGRVYTPQLVIDGRKEFVGSRGDKARDAIRRAAPLTPLAVRIDQSNLIVDIPALPTANNATVMVVGFGRDVTQPIGRGENGGRTITYTNPVTFIDYPSGWNGGVQVLSIPLTQHATGGYAVLIREGRAGPIIAAGQVKL